MAFICYKPKGSCPTCEHYRWDSERHCKACWAQYDTTHKKIVKKDNSTELREGLVVYIEGDSNDLWITDYNCRVGSYITLMETPKKGAKKVLVNIDNIGKDRNVTATMKLAAIKKVMDIKSSI